MCVLVSLSARPRRFFLAGLLLLPSPSFFFSWTAAVLALRSSVVKIVQ